MLALRTLSNAEMELAHADKELAHAEKELEEVRTAER